MELRSGKPFGMLLTAGFFSLQILSYSAPFEASSEVVRQIQTLKSTSETTSAKIDAVRSLEQLASESAPAASVLVDLLINRAEDTKLRLATATALKSIPADERTIPGLVVVLRDKKEAMELRHAAFDSYSMLASNSTVFINHFTKLVHDNSETAAIRDRSVKVLGSAATAFANDQAMRSGSRRELEEWVARLNAVRAASQSRGLALPDEVTRASEILEKKLNSILNEATFLERILSTPWTWPVLLLIPPLTGFPFWLLLLWKSPMTLWKINRVLATLPEVRIGTHQNVQIGFRFYLLVSLFQFHPRVLDAWLRQFHSYAKRGFDRLGIVADRNLHIAAPVEINRLSVEKAAPRDFWELFRRPRTWIVIRGEPGTGKSSLACQLGRWAMEANTGNRLTGHWMLPVLLSNDSDLPAIADLPSAIEAIATQVRTFCDNTADLSQELLRHLLEQKRILVIVDGLDDVVEEVPPWLNDASESRFPINALVITTRTGDGLARLESSVVEPRCLEAEDAPRFVGAILKHHGKRGLWDDREFLEECVHFIGTTRESGITPFLARAFAEVLSGMRESEKPQPLAANIPNLILSFVAEFNRRVPAPNRMTDRGALILAKAAAWLSVGGNFRVSSMKREELERALQQVPPMESNLSYLQQRSGLLQATDETHSRFRFRIGALAEWLAAMHAIETLKTSEQAWQRFLGELTKNPLHRATGRGFILALRECCMAQSEALHLPDFVELELGDLAGMDPVLLRRAQMERRIGHQIRRLTHPNPNERQTAVQILSGMGPAAEIALPTLVVRLRDRQESDSVRCAIAEAMVKIGGEADLVISEIVDCLGEFESELSLIASRVLTRLGPNAIAALIKAINDRQASEDLRTAAVKVLGDFKQDRPAALPALIQVLRDPHESPRVREAAVEALGRMGSDAEVAVPHLIDVMRESKSMSHAAAQALITLAPMARSAVIALAEALNPTIVRSSKDTLAALRRSLIQPENPNPGSAATEFTERIRQILRDALSKVERQQETIPQQVPSRAISLAS